MKPLTRAAHLLALALMVAALGGCGSFAAGRPAPESLSAADPALAYAKQVSQTSYTRYLRDLLYCHKGQDRAARTSEYAAGRQHDPARDAILKQLRAFGLKAAIEHVTVDGEPADNVVAVKTGTTRPKDVYILSAHYDSADTPGADDDASGTAAVLEAARVLSGRPSQATVYFIAFDAEENDSAGAVGWVAKHPREKVRGMVTMDMIAYNPPGATRNRARIYARRPGNAWEVSLAAAMALYGSLPTTRMNRPDEGDYWAFEQHGWQGCMVIEGADDLNPYYHKAADAWETRSYLDLAFATKMTRGIVGYFAKVAGFSPLPAAAPPA